VIVRARAAVAKFCTTSNLSSFVETTVMVPSPLEESAKPAGSKAAPSVPLPIAGLARTFPDSASSTIIF
jgi:hypothetical protein